MNTFTHPSAINRSPMWAPLNLKRALPVIKGDLPTFLAPDSRT
jgi:hypothetical protein